MKLLPASGDIYCLFYELGTAYFAPVAPLPDYSNKWMRAVMAEARKFLAEKTDPKR
jgi:hypothetical protein